MQLLCGFFKLPLKKDTVKSFLIIFKIMFLFPAVYNSSPGRLMLKSVSLLRISHLPQFENATFHCKAACRLQVVWTSPTLQSCHEDVAVAVDDDTGGFSRVRFWLVCALLCSCIGEFV